MKGLVLAAILGIPVQGAMYTAFPTSPLPWRGEDINDQGRVVGGQITSIYFDGSDTTTAGALGSGPGRNLWSVFFRINENDFMVGESTTSYQNGAAPMRGMIRNIDGSVLHLNALGSLGGISGNSAARDINDLNEIVGESDTPDGKRAVRFESDGTLTILLPDGVSSSAKGINNLGEVAGYYADESGKTRAFFLTQNGTKLNIIPESALDSTALRINNKNQVIGTMKLENGEFRGFIYQHNKLDEIPTFGGTFSEALGLNESGTVVGTARYPAGDSAPYVRYPSGKMIDLRKETAGIDYRQLLSNATAINNQGWIVAWASAGPSAIYTYILKPGAITATPRSDGKVEVRFGAPPGTKVRLERSSNLRAWSEVVQSTVQDEEIVHIEDAAAAGFFRGQILP